MGIQEKIREIDEEMHRTQKNKATEFHLGVLKAKMAKLRHELISPSGTKSSGQTFDVKRAAMPLLRSSVFQAWENQPFSQGLQMQNLK